jgi:hypothetical protein
MHAETSMAEEDLVDRIMMNRKQNNAGEAKFSEGGKVANQDEIEAGFDPNEFDDLHLRDDLESSYGEEVFVMEYGKRRPSIVKYWEIEFNPLVTHWMKMVLPQAEK